MTRAGDRVQAGADDWSIGAGTPGLFSVLVPTFDRAHCVVETLDSVLRQSYRPVEVVVVDDGSGDDTRAVVSAWSDRHRREGFDVLLLEQPNRGVCAARNRAVEASTGEFIQYLDSDDLLSEDRLERLAELFRSSGADFIETGFAGFRADDPDYSEVRLGHAGQSLFALLLRGRLWPNTLRGAYRRDLVRRVGPWRVGMATFDDLEYVIRALTVEPLPRVAIIEGVLAHARRSGERRSDLFRTRVGRENRVLCEEILAARLGDRACFEPDDRRSFARRLLSLAIRCQARGWGDLSERLNLAARSVGVQLDAKDRCKSVLSHSRLLSRAAVAIFGLAP